jgi:hypothetical protein
MSMSFSPGPERTIEQLFLASSPPGEPIDGSASLGLLPLFRHYYSSLLSRLLSHE